MVGALMVFGLGMVYCWIQAIISHKMRHQAMSSALSSCTRFVLSFLVTVFFIISILSLMQFLCMRKYQVAMYLGQSSGWYIRVQLLTLPSDGCRTGRVATVSVNGQDRKNKFLKVREKSENFILSQEKLTF